ncbi:MAG: hypothetical protein ACI906_004011 [Candidatus Latescibacterota bacterium]|jgi:hypothetical protein
MELGNIAAHDDLGRLMLLKSGVNIELVEAVGFHHDLNASSPPLVHLIHLANQLSKDIGMGYDPKDRGKYAAETLRHFAIDTQQVRELREGIAASINNQLEQCRPNTAVATAL